MADVFDSIAKALLELGFPGIVIIVLGFVSYKLYGNNSDLHEKRLSDSRSAIDAINANTNTLNSLTELLRDRAR